MTDTITKAEVIQSKEIARSNAMYNSELQAQRAMALARPRTPKNVLDTALAELALVPHLAQKAYYVIPFKDKESGGTKNVEGPSVKASRSLLRLWGNCACAGRIVGETDDRFELEAAFIDYETNAIFRKTVSVSKFYIPRETKIKTPLREDRLTLSIQAGLSKAERNATLSGLPSWLVDAYYERAKEIAAGVKVKGVKGKELPLPERYDKMYKAFAELGVERAKIEDFIKRTMAGKDDLDILSDMIGIHTAIKDNQITKEQVFEAPTEKKEAGAGPMNLEDVLPGIGE